METSFDDLIFRSKIILNIHYYEAAIFEIFRCSYLMANRKCIVSEVGNDKDLENRFTGVIYFSDYSNIVHNCVNLLNLSNNIDSVAEKGISFRG
jgi:hypothetical protein